jgi:integrase
MTDIENFDRRKKPREEKNDLDSRSFRDGAIYLFRRGDYKKPTWFCRVKVPGAKGYLSCSTKTTDEHEAFKFADDLFLKSLGRVANGGDLKSKKVLAAIDEYKQHVAETQKHRSRIDDKIKLFERLKTFFASYRLKEITTATLAELTDWMRENSRTKTLSPNSIKRYQAEIRLFLNWCVERGYLEQAPKLPKQKFVVNRRPHFGNADWSRLTRHMREFLKVKDGNRKTLRDRTMLVNYVLILANTGIRVGEARNLKWRDIREIPSPKGSNQPADIALYVTGKTGPREVVARTSDVKDYLKRILELRKSELENVSGAEKPKKLGPDDYIFCNRDGTPITSFKKSFTALVRSAKVETDSHGNTRTLYSLRHTYATFRLQEGVHQFILARNMGTSTAMLEKHYGHTSNVASAAELTKGGRFNGEKKASAVDWLEGL